MSYLIKPIVTLLLGALCITFIRGYSSFMKRRAIESGELLQLCRALRKNLATRLSTPKEAFSGVSGLSSNTEAFRKLVISGKTLSEAFCSVSGSLAVSRELKRILSEYFTSFGTSYLEDEIKCADELILSLSELTERELETFKKDEKVVKSVAVAITLGVIILII